MGYMVCCARAKCPRCGFQVSAASPYFRDVLARTHNFEAHGIHSAEPSLASPADACRETTSAPIAAIKPATASFVQPC